MALVQAVPSPRLQASVLTPEGGGGGVLVILQNNNNK